MKTRTQLAVIALASYYVGVKGDIAVFLTWFKNVINIATSTIQL